MRLLSPSSPTRSSLLLLSSTLLFTRPFSLSASALAHMSAPPSSASSPTSNMMSQSPFTVFSSPIQEQLKKQGLNLQDDSQPEMDPQTEQRIKDAQALFQSKVTLEILKRSWAPDAVFEDPIAYTKGYRQYAAQWWGMKVFSTSETQAWRLISSSAKEIVFAQKHFYAISKLGFKKEMHSTVKMELNEEGRIRHFQDRWDGKDMPGWWAWPFRRMNALTLPLVVSVPSKVHPDVAEGKASKGRQEL